jgi:hypothetical protein
LREALASADPQQVRMVLQALVLKVELWFSHVPWGRRTKAQLERGLITLTHPWETVALGIESSHLGTSSTCSSQVRKSLPFGPGDLRAVS